MVNTPSYIAEDAEEAGRKNSRDGWFGDSLRVPGSACTSTRRCGDRDRKTRHRSIGCRCRVVGRGAQRTHKHKHKHARRPGGGRTHATSPLPAPGPRGPPRTRGPRPLRSSPPQRNCSGRTGPARFNGNGKATSLRVSWWETRWRATGGRGGVKRLSPLTPKDSERSLRTPPT